MPRQGPCLASVSGVRVCESVSWHICLGSIISHFLPPHITSEPPPPTPLPLLLIASPPPSPSSSSPAHPHPPESFHGRAYQHSLDRTHALRDFRLAPRHATRHSGQGSVKPTGMACPAHLVPPHPPTHTHTPPPVPCILRTPHPNHYNFEMPAPSQ